MTAAQHLAADAVGHSNTRETADMTTDKSAAPERLWLEYTDDSSLTFGIAWSQPFDWLPAYTRSDLIPAMLQKARNAALREAERAAGLAFHTGAGANEMLAAHNGGIIMAKNHILALIDTPAPPTPAEPAGDALREAAQAALDCWDRALREAAQAALGCGDRTGPSIQSFEFIGLFHRLRAALAAAPAPQPETRAWAVVGEDGALNINTIWETREAVQRLRTCLEGRVVRVAIRVVDDEEKS